MPLIYSLTSTLIIEYAISFSHYHNFAFSWRGLELLREVIDVNKSPNLRTHISKIVDYFKEHYVSELSNGLFEYKFNKFSGKYQVRMKPLGLKRPH